MTVGLFDGFIKSCGNWLDSEVCFVYNPATNSWNISTSLIISRTSPVSSFIDGIWLVSGDFIYSDDFPFTTEMWTGARFEPGPSLPIQMVFPCQLTINSTHVFFIDTVISGKAFLLDWFEQKWTELPSMTVERDKMSCGLINNPVNGIEVVVVEHGVTEIFNFIDEEWRTGPTVEPFYEAGYAQIGDTFAVVGGFSYDEYDTSDRIYKFDHVNYDWILMSQRLQVPRSYYPGVVAVPDDFVNCS